MLRSTVMLLLACAGNREAFAIQSEAAPLPGPSSATRAAPDPLRPPLFRVGERLFYQVRWGVINVGTAELRVAAIDTIQGSPAAHVQIRITGSTYLFKMDNRMDSWIALSDTTSRRFTQDFNEMGKETHRWYDIFPDSGYFREKGVDSLQPTVERPLDDAAFFYAVRTLPLEPGKRVEVNRYFRPDRNPVILDVKARDTLDVPAGKFPSIVLQPIIKGRGILAETSGAQMWLTDDDRRLMVQLKSKFPVVGYLTMRLIRIEGADSGKNSP